MLFILIGCDNSTILESQAPTTQELEAIVKGNSLTLLEAVESFANDNYGSYPENADTDTTATGKVLIDYLPDGERLMNPFTGLRDQPIDSIPSSPGEICYFKFHYHECIYCYLNVYYIKGYGTNSIIVEHDNIEDTEALVIEDCLKLQRAVEAWLSDSSMGYYPCYNYDSNDSGNIVLDYLPNSVLMENRFTLLSTEPSCWELSINCCVGFISYSCIVVDGYSVGYTITGVGFEPGEYVFQLTVN